MARSPKGTKSSRPSVPAASAKEAAVPESIRINTEADFLQWLETGAELARETLEAAGLSLDEAGARGEGVDDHMRLAFLPFTRVVSGVTITSELAAAARLLQLVKAIRSHVIDGASVPRYRLVLLGLALTDLRGTILEKRWAQADLAKRQTAIARKRRRRGSLAEALAERYATWKQASDALEQGINGRILGFDVDENGDSLDVIRESDGKQFPAISRISLHRAFNRAKRAQERR